MLSHCDLSPEQIYIHIHLQVRTTWMYESECVVFPHNGNILKENLGWLTRQKSGNWQL